MKSILIIISLFISINTYANNLPACGQGSNDDAHLDWNKALDIKTVVAFIKDDAILCLANTPGNPFDIKYVIYRDSTGLEKKYKFSELENGTQTILTSDEITFGVVKKGKIMTLQLQRESIGVNFSQGARYKASLRFLRNLAKIPFDTKDHRILKVEIEQDNIGEFYPRFNGTDFDQIQINISTPTLVIKEIDLLHNGNIDRTIITNNLLKVDEL